MMREEEKERVIAPRECGCGSCVALDLAGFFLRSGGVVRKEVISRSKDYTQLMN
jgi:hypothetical protein